MRFIPLKEIQTDHRKRLQEAHKSNSSKISVPIQVSCHLILRNKSFKLVGGF